MKPPFLRVHCCVFAGRPPGSSPTLLRQGLLLTLRERWPEHPATFATDPSQLLAGLREHPYGLLVIDGAAFARALLHKVGARRWAWPGRPCARAGWVPSLSSYRGHLFAGAA